jgi:type I restriction enzyme R subunit
VGQSERGAQNRVVELFAKRLGYQQLGSWQYRAGNSSIEDAQLRKFLQRQGYDDVVIKAAIAEVRKAASVGGVRTLYEANHDVYELLRYGVPVKRGVADHFERVWLIDWVNPEENDFAVAEEVSVAGEHNKRPDVVLYVNGLALGVIELKRSKVSVSEGIRQNIGNQEQQFIRPFFATVQLLFAGNDVEGLRYGAIETREKYWLDWKEPEDSTLGADVAGRLDKALTQMCSKERLLELIHDFIVFDSGVKKVARHNQYFGVKAAQKRVRAREGGIIWHTQGSGKSLTMVWLAKWIREHQDSARVLIITDRTELDEQIEKVFGGVHEAIYRTGSGADLLTQINKHEPSLICSLVHKFRGGDEDKELDEAGEEFIKELNSTVPAGFSPKGNLYVFVDEAHRTQSGKMHVAMKKLLPGAMFIGFTGTPLLKADKATSIETFGSFIHTYKFDEAVSDGVVLDLRYQARDIDQELTSPEKADKWFEAKTKGLTDLSKAELKKRWGTMQKVVSAEPRAKQIVQDILLDMETEPRLVSGRGNAMLVGESIYQACKFYEMFVNAGFGGKCAIVTSYVPNASEISKENSGEGKTEKLRQYDIYRRMLAEYFGEPADVASTPEKVERFEQEVKQKFIDEPGQMRLIIVVDKLLTGFDAPSATYLYIDKKMRDHGLFQAICRVNRLDADDKTYGYIVDYRDLFNSLETAIGDYTSGALDGYETKDIDGLLKDRLKQARIDLDGALEKIRALVEPVAPPKGTLDYQHYFCASIAGDVDQLKANEPKRVNLYKAVSAVVRAYGAVANDMQAAGYSQDGAASTKREVEHFVAVRDEVKLGAGENLDMKQFEAGMRALLDTYIAARPSTEVATFEKGLVELIVERGEGALDTLPASIRNNHRAAAETIVNNVRRTIVDEHAMNPRYYDRMSALLTDLIEQRRHDAIDYKQYLDELLALATQVGKKEYEGKYPSWATSPARRALVDLAWPTGFDIEVVHDVIQHSKEHGWSGNPMKVRALKRALRPTLPKDWDATRVDVLIELLKKHHEYQ